MGERQPFCASEHHADEVRCAAWRRRGIEAVAGRIGADPGEIFGQCRCRDRGTYGKARLEAAQMGNRNEVVQRVIAQLARMAVRKNGHRRARREQQRQAIGRRGLDGEIGDAPARAMAIFHHNALPQDCGQPCREPARQRINGGAGDIADDQAHRTDAHSAVSRERCRHQSGEKMLSVHHRGRCSPWPGHGHGNPYRAGAASRPVTAAGRPSLFPRCLAGRAG